MIYPQTEKHVVLLSTAAVVATDATATGRVDCLGFNYLAVDVLVNSTTGGTSPPTVLKFTEGDTTTADTAIAELTGGTATSASVGFVIPATTTAAPAGIVRFNIDLKKRKRYLKISTTPLIAGGQLIVATAHLSRGIMPDTAAEAGVTALVNV